MSIEAIQAKRAARKAEAAKAREEQYEKDLVALDALEMELGDDRVRALEMPAHIAGLPVMVVVSCPSKDYYKKFQDMVRRAKGDLSKTAPASEQLADVCIAYPAKDVYAQLRAEFPGIHDQVANAAADLARAKDDAEGKG